MILRPTTQSQLLCCTGSYWLIACLHLEPRERKGPTGRNYRTSSSAWHWQRKMILRVLTRNDNDLLVRCVGTDKDSHIISEIRRLVWVTRIRQCQSASEQEKKERSNAWMPSVSMSLFFGMVHWICNLQQNKNKFGAQKVTMTKLNVRLPRWQAEKCWRVLTILESSIGVCQIPSVEDWFTRKSDLWKDITGSQTTWKTLGHCL